MPLNIELFIEAVKLRPALYDTKIKEYADKNLKKKLWYELCREFVEKLDELEDKCVSCKYTVLRRTENLHIPYYVKENFHTEYQGSVRRLEVSIEEEYLSNLRHACYRERNYRESMIWKARNFGDHQMFQQAQNYKMPSCEKLQNLRTHGA